MRNAKFLVLSGVAGLVLVLAGAGSIRAYQDYTIFAQQQGASVAVPLVLDNTVNKSLGGTGFSFEGSKSTDGNVDGIILIIAASSPEFDAAGLTRAIGIPRAVEIPLVTPAGTTTLSVSADGTVTCGGGVKEPACGDGVCAGDETPTTCPGDCSKEPQP